MVYLTHASPAAPGTALGFSAARNLSGLPVIAHRALPVVERRQNMGHPGTLERHLAPGGSLRCRLWRSALAGPPAALPFAGRGTRSAPSRPGRVCSGAYSPVGAPPVVDAGVRAHPRRAAPFITMRAFAASPPASPLGYEQIRRASPSGSACFYS